MIITVRRRAPRGQGIVMPEQSAPSEPADEVWRGPGLPLQRGITQYATTTNNMGMDTETSYRTYMAEQARQQTLHLSKIREYIGWVLGLIVVFEALAALAYFFLLA